MAITQSSISNTISIDDSMSLDDLVIDFTDMSTLPSGSLDDTITLDWNYLTAGSTLTNGATGAIWSSNLSSTEGVSSSSSKIDLRGANADITINGVSLTETLQGIQQRLNILTPNPEMEAEWDELHELGQRYRELEKQCMEKSQMWKQLKAMPPPEKL